MAGVQKTLFVMRHAESLEDVDQTAYELIADEDMPLIELGKLQAAEFSRELAGEIDVSSGLKILLSPSTRVLQTAQIIVSTLPKQVRWSLATSHLIAKQDWGSVTIHNRDEIEQERYRVGVLRYDFPNGERSAHMLKRFEVFADQLRREVSSAITGNVLVITHGFEFRVLLKSLFWWSEEYFELLAHPLHCEVKRIKCENGTFVLLNGMRKHGNPITRLSSRKDG